jgi:hypothetical protein
MSSELLESLIVFCIVVFHNFIAVLGIAEFTKLIIAFETDSCFAFCLCCEPVVTSIDII